MANRGCVEVSRKSEKPQAANTVPARCERTKRKWGLFHRFQSGNLCGVVAF